MMRAVSGQRGGGRWRRILLWSAALLMPACWVSFFSLAARVAVPSWEAIMEPGGVLCVAGGGNSHAEYEPSGEWWIERAPFSMGLRMPRAYGPVRTDVVDGSGFDSLWSFELPLWLPTAILLAAAIWVTLPFARVPAGTCPTCGYDLRGSASDKCSECGASIRRGAPGAPDRARLNWARNVASVFVRVLLSPWVALVVLWGSLTITLCTFVATGWAVIVACRCLWRRRFVGLAALVALSPFGVYSLFALSDYARGKGKLSIQLIRHDLSQFATIHPRYRCEQVQGHLRIADNAWATEGVYNMVLKATIGLLGPQRGSYVGPYPKYEECVSAARAGQIITPEQLLRDNFSIGERCVHLDHGVGIALLDCGDWSCGLDDASLWREEEEFDAPIRAAFCDGCVSIRLPTSVSSLRLLQPGAQIFVIDPEVGRPFACYCENAGLGSPLRVRWSDAAVVPLGK